MSQTSTRGPIVGHEARNLDAQRTFLNTFENIVNRRVNIPEDIRPTLYYLDGGPKRSFVFEELQPIHDP